MADLAEDLKHGHVTQRCSKREGLMSPDLGGRTEFLILAPEGTGPMEEPMAYTSESIAAGLVVLEGSSDACLEDDGPRRNAAFCTCNGLLMNVSTEYQKRERVGADALKDFTAQRGGLHGWRCCRANVMMMMTVDSPPAPWASVAELPDLIPGPSSPKNL